MNTRIIYIGLIILVAFSSCKKWLNVQPEDRFTGEQIFKTKDGFATAINGVYLDMSTQKLYGANLNSTILEVFAQRYSFDSQNADLYSYSVYDYNNANVKATIDQIWTSMYVNITNVNKFIAHLDADKGVVLSTSENSLFKGEAFGLRAFMHLDLLRMYGPVYNSADSTKPAIPYSIVAGTSYGPILPANQVMEKILSDLDSAESLLAKDPIKNGVQSGQNQTYLNNRNQRMNYFAVKGLQARALLYRGNKAEAFLAAKAVIEHTSLFPWVQSTEVLSESRNPNRIFSSELLFGLFSPGLYDVQKNYFSADVADKSILAPSPDALNDVFKGDENDYRYNPNWKIAPTGKSYKTFYKYADIEDKSAPSRFLVPLLRLSEVYYIAAESASDNVTAFSYLNTVRNNRGLLDVPQTASFGDELQNEYTKEFFGEGQLWFYYKRKKASMIFPFGNPYQPVFLNATKYVFPLPLSETSPR